METPVQSPQRTDVQPGAYAIVFEDNLSIWKFKKNQWEHVESLEVERDEIIHQKFRCVFEVEDETEVLYATSK